MSYLLCFVAIMAYFYTFLGFVAATESRSRGFCHVIYSFGIAKAAVQPLCVAVCLPGHRDLLFTLPSCGDASSG